MKSKALIVTLVLLIAVTGLAAQKADIATPSPASIFHTAGVPLAKVINQKSGLQTTVMPFAGPAVYIPAVNAGEIPLGINNPYDLKLAMNGEDYYAGKKYTDIRAVAILFPVRNCIYVKKSSNLKTVADLKGHPMADGYNGQKVILPALDAIYATGGITRADIKPVPVATVVAGADAFASGKVDAFFFSLGAAKVREVDAAVGGIRALQLDSSAKSLNELQKVFPGGYLRLEKPGPENPGIVEPVYSLAYDAVVFASTKTPDDLVYRVVKTIYENKAELGASFAPFNMIEQREIAKRIPIPYHPGAIRFYQEKGMWPPK